MRWYYGRGSAERKLAGSARIGEGVVHARLTAPLAFCMAGLLSGCSDKPGVVHMAISPLSETIDIGEPVRLKVSLKFDEMVCLARHYDVCVTLKRIGVDEDTIRPRGRMPQCGNAALVLLPLLPVILAARVIDVADLGGRYLLLRPGQTITNDLEIGGGNLVTAWFDQRPANSQYARPQYAWWTPGDYRVTVELENRGGTWPAPLFWSAYSHAVKAEATVHIAGASSRPMPLDATATSAEIVDSPR